MKKLARTADKIWNIGSVIAAVSLIAIMGLIIVNIISRRFFGAPIYGSTELVRYGALIGGAFALAQNEWFDGNIQMTLIMEKISEKAKLRLQVVVYTICTLAFVFITYLLIMQTINKFNINDLSVDLKLPIGVFAGILSFGFMTLTVCLAIKTILIFHQLKTGEALCGKNAAKAAE